jgi:hypothetical protein
MTARWIPVEEGLPRASGNYIVFAESADHEKPFFNTAYWFAEERCWGLAPVWAKAISHWMPLPDPPRVGPPGRRASRN